MFGIFNRERPKDVVEPTEKTAEMTAKDVAAALRTEAEERLIMCCDAMTPATVVWLDAGEPVQARFSQIDSEVVTLTVGRRLRLVEIPAAVCVTWVVRDQYSVFLSSGVTSPGEDRSEVFITIPQRLIGADPRGSFRVTVVPEANLAAEVRDATGTTYRTVVENLSLTGALLRIHPAEDPGFPVDGSVNLLLSSRHGAIELHTVVMRNDDRHLYGVHFPGTLTDGAVDAPDKLRQILRGAEADWLRKRKDPRAG